MIKKLNIKRIECPTWLAIVLSCAFAALTYGTMIYLSPFPFFLSMITQVIHPTLILLNLLPIILLFIFFYSCFNNLFFSWLLVFLAEAGLGLVNRFKIMVRDTPFIPQDILLLREAEGTFSLKYVKSSSLAITIVICLILVFLVLAFFIRTHKLKKSIRWMGASGAVLVFILSIFTLFSSKTLYQNYGGSEMYNLSTAYDQLGFNYAFINIATKTKIEKPEGYSESAAKEMLDALAKDPIIPKNKPDIIVVQGEAFYDLTLWDQFDYTEEDQPLKNYNRIVNSKQAIKGRTITHGFGGGTADSEFEVLTGMSTSFIGDTVPSAFSTINKNFFSFNRLLSPQGYTSNFYHPGKNWFYNRENVYRYLGYDKVLFKSSGFNEIQYDASGYATDSYFYDNFTDLYSKINNPKFLTGVTIENHGPYNDIRYDKTYPVKVKSNIKLSSNSKMILKNYVTGLKNGDDMLGKLTDFLDSKKRPTVLLFYGDHKPFLGDDYGAFSELDTSFGKGSSAKADIKAYETPYFIWSNKAFLKDFSNNKKGIGDYSEISTFYLGGLVTQLAGYEHISPFTDFVNDTRKALPVIHKDNYKTKEGYTKKLTDDEKQRLADYKALQYYMHTEEE